MHSRIFQITTKQVEKENYLNENILEQDDSVFIDYSSEIDDEEREECIAYLVENILPKEMFTRMEANVIRYNGGLKQWKEEAIANIIEKASAITVDNFLRALCLSNQVDCIKDDILQKTSVDSWCQPHNTLLQRVV